MALVANGINGINGTAGIVLTWRAKAYPEDLQNLSGLNECPLEGRRKGIRRMNGFAERIYPDRTADGGRRR